MEKKNINIPEILRKPYLNEIEAAAITGRAVSTLRNERHLRRGFPYLKIGQRSIRYKTKDIIAAMESRQVSFDQA
jgi:predicted DNA-binding transcriptional regulator AlpA